MEFIYTVFSILLGIVFLKLGRYGIRRPNEFLITMDLFNLWGGFNDSSFARVYASVLGFVFFICGIGFILFPIYLVFFL